MLKNLLKKEKHRNSELKDLLNDLERETEINQRIKDNLKKKFSSSASSFRDSSSAGVMWISSARFSVP